MIKSLLIAGAAVALVACGDKPQTAGGVKFDAAPYTGTGKPYVESGWKQGDKTSWEAQLKTRNQYGQNEYSRSTN